MGDHGARGQGPPSPTAEAEVTPPQTTHHTSGRDEDRTLHVTTGWWLLGTRDLASVLGVGG